MPVSYAERKVIGLESDSRRLPHAPRTAEETGLPFLFLMELVAKVLFLHGMMRMTKLAAHLKLSAGVIEALIGFMRCEKLCEVTRRGDSGTEADLTYRLTDAGRVRASEFMHRNSYAGPAPVSLDAYCAQVQVHSAARNHVTREQVATEFNDVVVSSDLLDKLGSAMNSGRALFIHGLAGSGKTFLAERLSRLLAGNVSVPYAVFVDGEVLQIHDPMVHRQPLAVSEQTGVSEQRLPLDARWVRCQRPAVLTGGELTLDMLELRLDPGTRFYQAPPHLKANNGIFVIDDLGRQRCSAIELMNRWIVPLDRHVDYLTLHTGHKFVVPFDVIVAFSSNFQTEQLADSSFFRRLGYKIYIAPQTESQYEKIFRQVCEMYGVPYSADAFRYLLHEHHYKEGRPLLACYPRDILGQVRDIALYEGRAPSLDEKVLDWAWNNYFVGA